jgi:hypothetical protein
VRAEGLNSLLHRPALVCENDLPAIRPTLKLETSRHFYNNLQESEAAKVTCALAGTHLGTLSPLIVAFHELWG